MTKYLVQLGGKSTTRVDEGQQGLLRIDVHVGEGLSGLYFLIEVEGGKAFIWFSGGGEGCIGLRERKIVKGKRFESAEDLVAYLGTFSRNQRRQILHRLCDVGWLSPMIKKVVVERCGNARHTDDSELEPLDQDVKELFDTLSS